MLANFIFSHPKYYKYALPFVDSTINVIQLNDFNDCISRKLLITNLLSPIDNFRQTLLKNTPVTWAKVHYIFSLLRDVLQLQRKRHRLIFQVLPDYI